VVLSRREMFVGRDISFHDDHADVSQPVQIDFLHRPRNCELLATRHYYETEPIETQIERDRFTDEPAKGRL
jgi:hypothetical protein